MDNFVWVLVLIFFPLLLFRFKIMIIRASKSYLKVHEKCSPSISTHRKGVVKSIGAMPSTPLCISQIFSWIRACILWRTYIYIDVPSEEALSPCPRYAQASLNTLLSIEVNAIIRSLSPFSSLTCTAATSKSFSCIQKIDVIMGVAHVFPKSQLTCCNFRTAPLPYVHCLLSKNASQYSVYMNNSKWAIRARFDYMTRC